MQGIFFVAAGLAALGLSGTASAQVATTPPRSIGAPITVRPTPELATLQPGPDEGKVEVKILGGGKVQFLGFTCAVTGSDPRRTCARITKRKSDAKLLAEPLEGYRFAGWSGGCAASNAQAQCTLAVDDSLVSATATFVKNAKPMITLSIHYEVPSMQGLRITLKPDASLSCTGGGGSGPGWGASHDCTAQFEQGMTVAIKAEDVFGTATPIDPKRWGGACKAATSTTCTLKLDQPQSVSVAMYK